MKMVLSRAFLALILAIFFVPMAIGVAYYWLIRPLQIGGWPLFAVLVVFWGLFAVGVYLEHRAGRLG